MNGGMNRLFNWLHTSARKQGHFPARAAAAAFIQISHSRLQQEKGKPRGGLFFRAEHFAGRECQKPSMLLRFNCFGRLATLYS